jgi:hypothetical protein
LTTKTRLLKTLLHQVVAEEEEEEEESAAAAAAAAQRRRCFYNELRIPSTKRMHIYALMHLRAVTLFF